MPMSSAARDLCMDSVRKTFPVISGTDVQVDTCCWGVPALTVTIYYIPLPEPRIRRQVTGVMQLDIQALRSMKRRQVAAPATLTPTSSPSSIPPTTIPIPTSPTSPTSPVLPISTSPATSSGGGNAKIGIIVGGAVGGIAIIGVVAIAVIVLLRRKAKTPDVSPQPIPPAPNNFQPPPAGNVGVSVAPLPQEKMPAVYGEVMTQAATPVNQAADPLVTSFYGAAPGAQSPVQPGSPAPQYQPGSPAPQYPGPGPVGLVNELPAMRH
ncbi:uncharacterized protein BDR25DRAFT_374019 [Lindgomyces ingoldianus]|uniref:Uncharacterized protein n=1 Tax=Lindgomyces ingoldianus TaxID=673940 RepID=A0ACB6QLP7_9PLEO|nr:uncharacterized protein BDR25DRAFT_374019 [Lindgomyces ingoldianus]KAF2467792.1 hypothetical protein BDR25DRAFT_374019 [Lindgomyces ingoldianus]